MDLWNKTEQTYIFLVNIKTFNSRSNLEAPRLGKLAELPLRLMSEPTDPGREVVLRDNSDANSLTLRTEGRLAWKDKYSIYHIYSENHLRIIIWYSSLTSFHFNTCPKKYEQTYYIQKLQPLSCWTRIYPAFLNSVDPDQLASEEANWSGSALFAFQYVNLYQQSESRNLSGWKLNVRLAS